MKKNKIKTRPVVEERPRYVELLVRATECIYDVPVNGIVRLTEDEYEYLKEMTWEEQQEFVRFKMDNWTHDFDNGKYQGKYVHIIEKLEEVECKV